MNSSLIKHFHYLLEEKSIKCEGLEVSEVAIQKAKDIGVMSTFYNLDIEEIDEYKNENKYNEIILKLVIAFIRNRANLFIWIKEHLKENGEVIIITPTLSRENEIKMPGIAIKKTELENLLTFVFGKFEIKDVMETPNGKIYTYSVLQNII